MFICFCNSSLCLQAWGESISRLQNSATAGLPKHAPSQAQGPGASGFANGFRGEDASLGASSFREILCSNIRRRLIECLKQRTERAWPMDNSGRSGAETSDRPRSPSTPSRKEGSAGVLTHRGWAFASPIVSFVADRGLCDGTTVLILSATWCQPVAYHRCLEGRRRGASLRMSL